MNIYNELYDTFLKKHTREKTKKIKNIFKSFSKTTIPKYGLSKDSIECLKISCLDQDPNALYFFIIFLTF